MVHSCVAFDHMAGFVWHSPTTIEPSSVTPPTPARPLEWDIVYLSVMFSRLMSTPPFGRMSPSLVLAVSEIIHFPLGDMSVMTMSVPGMGLMNSGAMLAWAFADTEMPATNAPAIRNCLFIWFIGLILNCVNDFYVVVVMIRPRFCFVSLSMQRRYVITRIIVGCKCRYYFGSYQQPIMVVNYF